MFNFVKALINYRNENPLVEKTILIVDDSEFDRNLLKNAFSRKGQFKFLEANDGLHSLVVLANNSVDLVLMDIMMPGTFGSQILLKIREKFNPIELPIIMVTSKIDSSDVIECLHNGANDYITKPVNFEVAISRIMTHLKLADLSMEMAKLKEITALDAMITTYNHEINNPLSIAISYLNNSLLKDEKVVEKLRTALWRIADVVKKIREVSDKKETKFGTYSGSTKMIKIK